MRHRRYFFAIPLVLACNNNPTPTGTIIPGTVTNGVFAAVVTGATWSAFGPVAVSRPVANAFGITAISMGYTMVFAVNGVTGPGTYNVGASGLQGSQIIIVGPSQATWVSNKAGGTGSIVFTTVAANHIVGTFAFDAPAMSGTTSTLHVANGVFDLTF